MPRIPTYQAGNLASEQTGVPSPDRSGEIISDSVTRVAAQAVNIIGDAVQKQKALLKKAELSKRVSQFDSDMMVASEQIRQQYLSNPDEGVKVLREKRTEIFNQYKNDITDPDVKLSFDAFGTETIVQGEAKDQIWAFRENNKIIQQTHFDRLTQDADFAGQTDSLEQVIEKAARLDADREDFYQAWGGVLEGSKVIDSGQESMVKSYFYGQLSKGNAFKVLKEIDDGRLGPLEGTNGLISAMELKGMRSEALKMAKANMEDGIAQSLIDSVQSNFKIDEALQQPISATEEEINSLSFLIGQKKELAANGEVDPEEIRVLESQQKILEKIREAQLSRSEMHIVPDIAVDAEMDARFLGLFVKGNKNKPFKATLEDVFKFQQDLMDNRERMTPAVFKKLSLMTEKSFQGEINGFVSGSKFKTKKSWFGLGGLEAQDKGRLSTSKKLRNVFSDIIEKHDPALGNADLFETMRIFYDDLDELVDLKDAPAMEAVSQEILTQLADGAKRKMQLKKMGLPIFLGEKSVIYRGGAGYVITGFDTDGMPLLEPK